MGTSDRVDTDTRLARAAVATLNRDLGGTSMGPGAAAFPRIDFERYHREELPALLAGDRRAHVAKAARALAPLAFRLREGGAYTYRPSELGIELLAGDADAATVIELESVAWEGLVHELEAPAGLLYAQRLHCTRGRPLDLMAWEPALRALYNGRPPYDPAEAARLADRRGRPLDPEATFGLASDREDMAHFLRTAGYLFVRGAFAPDEIAAFRDEAACLRAEARPGDKLSWWGRDAVGRELLCRVTRAASKPRLGSLPADPRILNLRDLADGPLVHRRGEGDGVTVIWKQPRRPLAPHRRHAARRAAAGAIRPRGLPRERRRRLLPPRRGAPSRRAELQRHPPPARRRPDRAPGQGRAAGVAPSGCALAARERDARDGPTPTSRMGHDAFRGIFPRDRGGPRLS
jgi:hypothetical protein